MVKVDQVLTVFESTPKLRFPYPYDEFAGHVKAMKTVREWEYTSRFGFLGKDQTHKANASRAIEYFSDCYDDLKEAYYKVDVFLSVYDYIGRHESLYLKYDLLEKGADGTVLVEAGLLRAVHHAFTALSDGEDANPKKVLALATAFRELEKAG